jgi:hypothetical protein
LRGRADFGGVSDPSLDCGRGPSTVISRQAMGLQDPVVKQSAAAALDPNWSRSSILRGKVKEVRKREDRGVSDCAIQSSLEYPTCALLVHPRLTSWEVDAGAQLVELLPGCSPPSVPPSLDPSTLGLPTLHPSNPPSSLHPSASLSESKTLKSTPPVSPPLPTLLLSRCRSVCMITFTCSLLFRPSRFRCVSVYVPIFSLISAILSLLIPEIVKGLQPVQLSAQQVLHITAPPGPSHSPEHQQLPHPAGLQPPVRHGSIH